MPPAATPDSLPRKISSWLWVGLTSVVLLASGCASTTSTPPQSSIPNSSLLAYRDSDQIGALLQRIDQRKTRSTRQNRAGVAEHGNGIIAPEAELADQALAYLGTRYQYGGVSPSGFDCSGLVWYIAKEKMGVNLPRTSADQAKQGVQVARSELQRGDLVFFNTMGRRYSHVGIYLGAGEFVHAPSSGGKVRVEKLSTRYWNSRYNGARRLDALTQLASR